MSNKTVKNVGIVLGCSLVAKVLSYVWESVLAAYLGATDQADALYMTTSIFGILYPILDMGIWKVFLPIYKTKLVEKEESRAERIANISVTLFFMLSIALVLLLIVCARPLVSVMAPGFAAEKKTITIQYLRISAPTYLLMAVSSVIGAMLQSREKFLGSQIREIGTHLSKIIYLFVCFRFLNVYAAVTAMIVGNVFRLLVQLPFINWKWKFRPDFDFKDKDIVGMLKGLPSVAVTAAIMHINSLVDKIVASGAGSGSVACLNYGNKLMSVFSGTVSTAISTAVYPTMIHHIAEKKTDRLKELFTNVVVALSFIIVPISIFCVLFSKQMVTVAFERGAFDSSATSVVTGVFAGYCIGMLFTGITTVISNVFYGYGDTKITMYISIVEIAINVAADLLLVRWMGVAGLAVATSGAAVICMCIRLILLRKYIRIEYKAILKEEAKIVIIAAAACAVPFILMTRLIHWNVYLSLITGAVISVGIYGGLALLFRLEIVGFLKSLIKRKAGGQRQGE